MNEKKQSILWSYSFLKHLFLIQAKERKQEALVIKVPFSGREYQIDVCSSPAQREEGDMKSYLLTLNICLVFRTIAKQWKD